jgi:opacity protein-like surface antigen
MKKLISIFGLLITITGFSQESSSLKTFKPGLSIMGGIQNNNHWGFAAPVYGIEFSMECPLVHSGKNNIRQKISLLRMEGKRYKAVSAEINPQFNIFANNSFETGVGPSIGMLFTRITETNKPVFSYGLGAGAVYTLKNIFMGVESRYAFTKQVSFDKEDNKGEYRQPGNLNNLRVLLKLGYKLY